MPDFSNGVATPGGASFMAPQINFANFANWFKDFQQGQQGRQVQQLNDQSLQTGQQVQTLNDQRIATGAQQQALANAFPNGLPTDPKTGALDYAKVAQTFAKFGAMPEALNILQQQPAPRSPMLSGQPGAPAAASGDLAATTAKIIQAEGAGKNPRSSADGVGQFTDATWIESIKKYFPNLAEGKSDDQLLAMRKIPQLASRVTEAFTSGNEAGLSKAGLPVTPATTYLAHFAGLGGAIKVLQADPNTPVEQILGNAALKANPFLRGMTARDLELWAARKMQGPAMVAQNAQAPQGGAPPQQVASAAPGNLPPSANAGSPAPQINQPPAQAAPIGAGVAQPQQPAQPQPQPQPQQPLMPQEPLPQGYTDPMQYVRDLRAEADRLSGNQHPGAKEQVARLDAKANRIENSIKPIEMHPGTTVVDPRSRETLYSAPSNAGGQAGQLVRLENSDRAARGEPPMNAQEEISFIQGIHPPRSAPAMAVEAFKKDFQAKNGRPPNGEEITKFAANYSGEQSYGRTAGSQGARVENASNEVEQLIPQAVEASRNYARVGGKYVGLNKLFQAYDQGTSDPKYNDFVLANFSLINAYTRAMNPQGVPRIQERLEQHAMGILSTATDEKAYEVQVRRLWKEVQASKTATAKTAEGRSPGDINSPVPGIDKPASTPGTGGQPAADGATVYTLPNGSKARVQEVE